MSQSQRRFKVEEEVRKGINTRRQGEQCSWVLAKFSTVFNSQRLSLLTLISMCRCFKVTEIQRGKTHAQARVPQEVGNLSLKPRQLSWFLSSALCGNCLNVKFIDVNNFQGRERERQRDGSTEQYFKSLMLCLLCLKLSLIETSFSQHYLYLLWKDLFFSLSQSCSIWLLLLLPFFLSMGKLWWLCRNFCQLYTTFLLRSHRKTHFCLITHYSGLFLLTLNSSPA